MKICRICGAELRADQEDTVYSEAGEWLAESLWKDRGELCCSCLESRAKLAMMYLHEWNR